MNVAKMATFLNKEAYMWTESLTVNVQVIDMRTSFGEVQALVTPICGTGQKWVAFTRLTMTEGVFL